MRYKCKCVTCGATAWISGSHDYETNSLDLDDREANWSGGSADCDHEEYDVIDQEQDNEP